MSWASSQRKKRKARGHVLILRGQHISAEVICQQKFAINLPDTAVNYCALDYEGKGPRHTRDRTSRSREGPPNKNRAGKRDGVVGCHVCAYDARSDAEGCICQMQKELFCLFCEFVYFLYCVIELGLPYDAEKMCVTFDSDVYFF